MENKSELIAVDMVNGMTYVGYASSLNCNYGTFKALGKPLSLRNCLGARTFDLIGDEIYCIASLVDLYKKDSNRCLMGSIDLVFEQVVAIHNLEEKCEEGEGKHGLGL